MASQITGIDHCVILVEKLDTAYSQIRQLGFTVQPRGTHSENMGTHNHCVMLNRGYFEILSIRHPTKYNERWREVLAQHEGLGAIALEITEARACYEQLRQVGVDATEPVNFSRPVDLPEGSFEARFSVTVIPDEETPGIAMFACEHHTRNLVWHPSYLSHENGATAIAGAVVVVDDPASAIDSYSRVFGGQRVNQTSSGLTIGLPGTPIELLSPDLYTARYPLIPNDTKSALLTSTVLRIRCASLDTVRKCLDHNAVDYHPSEQSVCVPPVNACGAVIEFVE
jgi:hypothetical protein